MKKILLFFWGSFLVWPPTTLPQAASISDLGNYAENIRITANKQLLLGHDLAVGDFNGDGYKDILMGAYLSQSEEGYNVGRAYIAFGGPTLRPLTDLSKPSAMGVVIHGDDSYDFTGFWVASGDINGDGIADAIIAADQNFHVVGRGTVYIIYGRTDWPQEIDLDTTDNPSQA